MLLRVRQTIEVNKVPVCYNGKGDDGAGGVVHYFTSKVPGKETTFAVPKISIRVLSRVLDQAMDRYGGIGEDACEL
jgi:hypothetical protein